MRATAYTFSFVLLFIFSLNALAEHPPLMGWSSWNTYRVNISDSLIRLQAETLLKSGLAAKGYRFVNIDDGYFGRRDPNTGRLLTHPLRFPNGLKPVVDYVHGLGLKAGIYSDAGKNTCGSYWDKDSAGLGVGLYGHDEEDADYFFRENSFDFIKVDFCGGDAKQNLDRLQLSERERYSAISRAMRRVNPDVRLNVCRWAYPGTWVKELADSWRISPDITPDWGSIRTIIFRNLYLSGFASDGHYNDMDMLEVGRGLGSEEEQTHFAMWCMMSSPLLIGCDLTKLPRSTFELLSNEELIALNQNQPRQQAYVVKTHKGGYVLVKDVGVENGRERAVACFNATDKPIEISLTPKDIDLNYWVSARDILARRDMPLNQNSKDLLLNSKILKVKVPARATRVYILRGAKRLERRVYEAETAFLPCYQEIRPNEIGVVTPGRTSVQKEYSNIAITGLGNGRHNSIVWQDVYSDLGGEYSVKLFYALHPEGNAPDFVVDINGHSKRLCLSRSLSEEKGGAVEFVVHFKKGRNRVEIYHPTDRLVIVDKIEVSRVGKKN